MPLGLWRDKKFARGVLEQFLGVISVDPVGKHSVGNGVLYVTNGFKCVSGHLSWAPVVLGFIIIWHSFDTVDKLGYTGTMFLLRQ